MGIFEKSIPKYVVNPIDQQVEVVPQDVYVDDIFDPIFNANVRNAMRQKYGGGLYGVLGGYEEMLKNAWGGSGGILGKGMGVLSTFGRSMEKADDLVLGALTEGIEGITGQGFDNPFRKIFVDDEDYTGKRLLAATANTFRGLAGTSVTEDDFGTAWNIPALGAELATDVGILGSSLSRKLAPKARDFTSKELFQNLGKSDLKTTVGEIGQLMSNYDDLMTRVAIDVTAPGLRPAFKGIKNKLMQHFATHSYQEYVDVIIALKTVEDASADPAARKQAQEFLRKSKLVNQNVDLFKEADEALAEVPDDYFYLDSAETPTVDRLADALQRDLDAEAFANQNYAVRMNELKNNIQKSVLDYNKKLWEAFEESRRVASEYGWETDLNRYLELSDPVQDKIIAEEVIPTIESVLPSINSEYVEAVEDLLNAAKGSKGSKPNLNPLRYAIYTREFTNNDAANDLINTAINTRTKYVRQPYTPYRVSPSLRSAVGASGAAGTSYAHSALQKIITQDIKSNKKLFKNPQELRDFFNSPDVQDALSKFIPLPELSKYQSAGLGAEDIARKKQHFANKARQSLIDNLEQLYFPNAGMSTYDYTTLLTNLEDVLSRNAFPDMGDPMYKFLKTITPEEAAKYIENPEKLLSLERFLAERGLVKYEYYDEYIPNSVKPTRVYNITTADNHAAAAYLLEGEMPSQFKYYPKLRKGIQSSASRLRSEYRKALEALKESLSNPTSKRANDFFDDLFNTVDDISQTYLQPLRNETPHSILGINQSLSLDKPLKEGSENGTTFADLLSDTTETSSSNLSREFRKKNKLDSEYALAVSRAIRDWARNTIPSNATFEQVRKFSRPLSGFLSFGYKLGADTPIPKKAVLATSAFSKQVMPIVERLMSNSAYGNLNLAKVFTKKADVADLSKVPKEVADDIKKLRNLLGTHFADNPHSSAYTFRTLFNNVVSPYPVKDLKFESKHDKGNDVEKLTKFLEKPRTPEELRTTLYPYFNKAYQDAILHNQGSSNLVDLADRFYQNLDDVVKDLGVDEQYLNTLFDKVRQKGVSALNPEELSMYRAYVSEVSKVLSQTPYRVFARDALQYSAHTDWKAIRDFVNAKYPYVQHETYNTVEEAVKPARYYEDPRLHHLNVYHDIATKQQGIKDTVRTRVLEGVTHTQSPESVYLDKLLKREREYVLDISYQKRLKRWHAEHPYYTYLKEWHDNYFKIPHPSDAVQNYYKQVSDKLSKYSAELDRLQRTSKKGKFYYTKKDLEFVRDKVIPLLPNNVKGYWNPSKSKGLFNFELPEADAAYTFQIGTDIDVRPERFQIDRFLKDFKGNLDDLESVRFIDYGKLKTASGTRSLQELATRTYLDMDYIVNTEAELANVYKELYESDEFLKSVKKPAAEKVKDTLYKMTSEEAAKMYPFVNLGVAAVSADSAVEELAGDMKQFAENGGTAEAGRQIYGERRWRWFEIINDSMSVSDKNARRLERASIRTKEATALSKRFRDYVNRIYVRDGASKCYSNLKRFYILRQQELGDIVSGKDFWTVFRRTGMLAAPYKTGSKQMTDVLAALTKNAELINNAASKNIVEVVTEDIGLGRSVVVFRFTGDKNTVKYVKKASKKLASAQYSDIVFSPPKALTGAERAFMDSADIRELSVLMEDLQGLASEQAKLLGFQFDNITPYTHHTMRRDKNIASWLDTHFYSKMSSEEYDEMSKLISNFDEYRKTDRGAFGTMLQDRRYRGDYWMFDIDGHNPVFDYNPTNIFTSTLVDGMFANLQYQDFTDLFINDNFKIKGVFETVEDLKKVLYAKDSKGRLSGNFANSELVSYKLDENGRLTGLVKYDKATDAGLKKALADPNTILVPANAISYMDNVLRKDVRMNNKFWTFINKHFTIPFKFGLLSNPGFLLGNISDSTFKLATTMSEKYGTSFTKEAANVAECLNASMALKNEYYEAFNVWKKVSLDYDIRLSPEALIPDIVAMSPKYKETFLEWLNGTLEVPFKYQNEAGIWITEYRKVPCELPDSVIDNASIWTMLQGVQMSSSKMREYAELAEISPTSNFNVATNAFDRITQGSGAYDPKKPSTWGIYMNNPPMKKLTGLSTGWEDLIRTASILDDLRHGQYSKEDFAIFARGHKGGDDAIKMRVRLDEAKNTMFNAQFDYERQSDFISKIGKTVPFPIFFLKNFEYWMEMLENNPQFIDNVIDVQEGLWSGYNEEGDEFKTEAKGRGAIPVGGKALPDWFKGIYKPSPLQSMFGAFSLLNDPIDNLSYRVNPLIGGAKAAAVEALPDSELTTLLSDPDSVKYRPYSTDMYERNIKQGDPNFSPAAYTLHRMNPYDRAMNAHLRIPEKAKAGELQMSDVLPSVFQPVF